MTAEVQFAKQFLAAVDSRPIKLQPDYAVDPRTYTPQGPYTLPRMPTPMKKPEGVTNAPGSAPATTVILKSTKNPPIDLSLPAQPLTTSVLDLKRKVAAELGLSSTEKIRLLYNKKPSADSKSIKDIIGDCKGTNVEFSVMIMGGMPTKSLESAKEDTAMEDAPVAQGESGTTVMESAEFWTDLQGFLEQRVRDRQVAEKATKLFAKSWKEQ